MTILRTKNKCSIYYYLYIDTHIYLDILANVKLFRHCSCLLTLNLFNLLLFETGILKILYRLLFSNIYFFNILIMLIHYALLLLMKSLILIWFFFLCKLCFFFSFSLVAFGIFSFLKNLLCNNSSSYRGIVETVQGSFIAHLPRFSIINIYFLSLVIKYSLSLFCLYNLKPLYRHDVPSHLNI